MSEKIRTSVSTAFMVALFLTAITTGCISQTEGEAAAGNTYGYTIEEYRDNEVYSGSVETASEISESDPTVYAQTPGLGQSNPYSTEKQTVDSQHEELRVLIENSAQNLLPLSGKLKYSFYSKTSVERLKRAAEEIKDNGILERKELAKLILSKEYAVAKSKYKYFLDTYIENSDRIIRCCDKVIEDKSYGSDTKDDKYFLDFTDDRIEEYEDAGEVLLESKEILEGINL